MTNKNIVITGASSGIGKELLKLLEDNNKIIVANRNIEKIHNHKNIIKITCDVSKKNELDNLFLEINKHFKKIDIFFSNAGFAYYEKIEKPDWEHINKIFQTNFNSQVYMIKKLQDFNKTNHFNFVITASAMSFLAMPGYSLYSATKHALKGFFDAFTYELEPQQNINMVYPIATLTNFFKDKSSMPWPRQKASYVAKTIIKNLKRNKKHIFPSKLFLFMKFVNNFLPIFKFYNYLNYKKFKKHIGETK